MDKKYYSTTVQLIGMLIFTVGLLITSSQISPDTDELYIFLLSINLILLMMLLIIIFCILLAMWGCDTLNDSNYQLINNMLLMASYPIPVVLFFFGFVWLINTKKRNLSYDLKLMAYIIHVIYFVKLSCLTFFGINLQIKRKVQ